MAAIFLIFPTFTTASETVILNITLNQEGKGEFFVNLADDGDFLVKETDLLQMGLRGPFTKIITIAGEGHVALTSVPGLTFSYNEKDLSLEIVAPPDQFPIRTIDFTPPQPLKIFYPQDSAAFLNYRLDYATGDSFGFKNFALTNELGARSGNLLFLTDTSYQNDTAGDRFVRLMSSLVYDRRPELQRFIIGDIVASSGELGASGIMGGVSFSKLYRMNPNLIYHPTLSFSGLATLPSEAEIYLDGMRIRTEKISPGGFNLENIYGYGGSSLVEVVLKDAFGREERIKAPFYFTDVLLKEGLHEYSYNLGAIRENYGTTSNRYGKLAFSGFHWYGVTDAVTLGLRAEGTGSLANVGPQASFLIPRAGTITVSLAGSRDSGKGGSAGLFAYTYQGKQINWRVLARGFSRGYATIATTPADKKTRYVANAGGGYSSRTFGSIAIDLSSSRFYEGDRFQTLSTTYSRNLFGSINLYTTYRRIMEPQTGNEFSIGINYYPGSQVNLAASYQHTSGIDTETLQVQKNLPVGEGPGFNVTVERSDTDTYGTINRFAPSLQYNAKHGTYAAEYSYQNSDQETTDASRLSVGGAIVAVGSTVGFVRPVTDSFGIVKVGNVEGVRIYQNNQEIARTDASGKAFVPSLNAFYYNQVSINDADVPIDYQLTKKLVHLSPPYRSGSCIIFETSKLQAIAGLLVAPVDGEQKPVRFGEIIMDINGKPVTFQTGGGGEFYLDNYTLSQQGTPDLQELGCQAMDKTVSSLITPGTYKGTVSLKGHPHPFTITIPDSADPIVDLGTIVCETPRQLSPPPPVGSDKPAQPDKESDHSPAPTPAPPQQTVATTEGPRPTMPPVGADIDGRSEEVLPATPHGETGVPIMPPPPSAPAAEQSRTIPPAASTLPPQEPAPRIGTPGAIEPVDGGAGIRKGEPMPAVIRPAPLPPATRPEGVRLEVYFEFDTDRFSSGQDRALVLTAARLLTVVSDMRARIEGHTDQLGSDSYNIRLGKQRGRKIVSELERAGVGRKKIAKVSNFGERKPSCPSLDEDCRRQNRRGIINLYVR